ncbi:MAG: PAS domain S-box protein [Gammaproteobacteria bacterium]|nr:PAS domain S-box protein [Gammaproteobacteria bacterium]
MNGELQALLDACIDAVVIIDHRGRVATFNRTACRMFGYPLEEVLGRNVSMLMPSPDREQHDQYLARYLQTGTPRVIGIGREVMGRRRDGSEFPASLAIGRIEGRNPPHFVGFLHDLSSRRAQEAQRQAAEEAVREARERLTHVARLSTMGEMTTGLAHEINQPLTAITLYAQAAERLANQATPDLGEIIVALRQISAQALRAGEIIRRLRELVRNRQTHEELLDLNAVVRELAVLAESDARVNDVRLVMDLAASLPPVLGDAIQLQQVMLNLVRNAIDAVQAEGCERLVTLRTARAGSGVEMSVSDLGPGLDAAIRDRLFEAFATTKPSGTGLGLAISRSIVEAHGGQLDWRPNGPRGSCFHFLLPAVNNGEST